MESFTRFWKRESQEKQRQSNLRLSEWRALEEEDAAHRREIEKQKAKQRLAVKHKMEEDFQRKIDGLISAQHEAEERQKRVRTK